MTAIACTELALIVSRNIKTTNHPWIVKTEYALCSKLYSINEYAPNFASSYRNRHNWTGHFWHIPHLAPRTPHLAPLTGTHPLRERTPYVKAPHTL